jgi:centrosomal protein CEP76
LQGFGLKAYVCIGENAEGAHAWVMQTDAMEDGSTKVAFWESLTGQKLSLADPRIHRFYRKIGCVFNQDSFYANIQADDRVVSTIFEIDDDSLWKRMDPEQIKSLPPVP